MFIEERRNELLRIINEGLVFEVIEVKKEKKYFFSKPKIREIKHEFKIKELTFSTADRISLVALDMEQYANENDFLVQKREAINHRKNVCKIIAIAILGIDYNEEVCKKITELIYNFCHPSDSYRIFKIIDIASNLGDFTNSIRLVTAANTMQKEKEAERIDQESLEYTAQ